MEIKQLLKELIQSKIEESDKTVGSISSYSIYRSAGGIYSLKLFWKGKTKKGESRDIDIELDKNEETALIALKTINEVLNDDAENVDLITRLQQQAGKELGKKSQPPKGW